MPVFDMEIWAVRMDAAQREVYAKRQLLKKEALRLGKERKEVECTREAPSPPPLPPTHAFPRRRAQKPWLGALQRETLPDA